MGRPERQLDPDGGPLQAFAQELRALREAAGRPKYSVLAQRAGRSQTALSEAAGGRRLPTWETVEAFARGCGADPERLRQRWEEALAAEPSADPPPAAAAPGPPGTALTSRRAERPRRRMLLWVAATLAGLAGLALILGNVVPEARPRGAPASPAAVTPTVVVADGADPMETRCYQDPEVSILDSVEIAQDGLPVGRIELRYAPRCGAAWARFWPFARAPLRTGAVVHVDTLRPQDGWRTPYETRFVGEAIFGNMLRNTDSCVAAAVRIEGVSRDRQTTTACFRGATRER